MLSQCEPHDLRLGPDWSADFGKLFINEMLMKPRSGAGRAGNVETKFHDACIGCTMLLPHEKDRRRCSIELLSKQSLK